MCRCRFLNKFDFSIKTWTHWVNPTSDNSRICAEYPCDYGSQFFLYFDFLQKNQKKIVFFANKKQKKEKKISALLFLLIMIQIQILLNKITKMLVENEKIPIFGWFSWNFSKKSLKIDFSFKKLKKFQKKLGKIEKNYKFQFFFLNFLQKTKNL